MAQGEEMRNAPGLVGRFLFQDDDDGNPDAPEERTTFAEVSELFKENTYVGDGLRPMTTSLSFEATQRDEAGALDLESALDVFREDVKQFFNVMREILLDRFRSGEFPEIKEGSRYQAALDFSPEDVNRYSSIIFSAYVAFYYLNTLSDQILNFSTTFSGSEVDDFSHHFLPNEPFKSFLDLMRDDYLMHCIDLEERRPFDPDAPLNSFFSLPIRDAERRSSYQSSSGLRFVMPRALLQLAFGNMARATAITNLELGNTQKIPWGVDVSIYESSTTFTEWVASFECVYKESTDPDVQIFEEEFDF